MIIEKTGIMIITIIAIDAMASVNSLALLLELSCLVLIPKGISDLYLVARG